MKCYLMYDFLWKMYFRLPKIVKTSSGPVLNDLRSSLHDTLPGPKGTEQH